MEEGSTAPGTRAAPARLRFGPFELRTESGELFRAGERVHLQPQPARLLELLARRSGEVLPREEICRRLWGDETFLELEQGLNFSIRQIRIALGDSATEPRYLETLPRRGYRFRSPVRTESAGAAPESPGEREGRESAPDEGRPSRARTGLRQAANLTLAALLFAALPGGRPEASRALPRAALSAPAFRAYTEGRFLAQRGDPADRDRALALLEEAALLAPRFAPASATYARLRLDFHQPPESTVPPAEAAARRALALDPCLNEARLVLVDIALYFRFDGSAARRELDRALACGPRDPEARRVLAAYHAARGRFGEALETARQAQLLDPQSLVARADLAWYAFLARRYGEALDLARRSLALQPEDLWTRQLLIELALATGQPDLALAEANALLRQARKSGRLPLPPERVASLPDYWELVLRRRVEAATRDPVAPVDFALPLLHLGETERALGRVEESVRRKFGWSLAFLAVDPRFDRLRGEPRFRRALRSLGLNPHRS